MQPGRLFHRDGREAGRVRHRRLIRHAAREDPRQRVGADLGFLVGDVPGLGLRGGAGVAQDVDLGRDRARIVQHVDRREAPRRSIGQSAALHERPGPLARDQVDDVGLEAAAVREIKRPRRPVDVVDHGVVAVFQHRAVQAQEGAHEVVLLDQDVRIGVQHDDLAARLLQLEPVRQQAGALVGAGRAAVGRLRDGEHDRAASGHGVELAGQQGGLRASLPGVRHQVRVGQAGDGVELDAGRHDDPVRRQHRARRQCDPHQHRVDGTNLREHRLDAVLGAQRVVLVVQARQRALAGQDHAAHDVGGVDRRALDQRHLDRIAPHPHVFREGGAGHAAADDDHAGFRAGGRDGQGACGVLIGLGLQHVGFDVRIGATAAAAGQAQQGRGGQQRAQAEEIASLHGGFLQRWVDSQAESARIWASV